MNGKVTMNRWTSLAAVTVLFLAVAGKAGETGKADAAPQGKTAEITLTPDKQFKVGDDTVTLAKLPDKLRKAGADRTTQILIAIDPSTKQETLKAIAGKLRAAGFTRMMFTKPRHADAHIGADPQAPSTARKASGNGGR
jgi:biopolymer transport protein ExbD